MSATVDHVVIDTGRLARFADNCNADRRFIEKHWVESPETISELMATDAFKDSLRGLRRGVTLTDGDHVAALFMQDRQWPGSRGPNPFDRVLTSHI